MKILFLLPILLITSCANRGGVSGGSEDKTAPVVVSFKPENLATGIPKKPEIEIVFDEWLEENASKQSVFVSPSEPGMKIDVSGKKIRVIPRAPLLDSTTYSITVGTGARDLRGNALLTSFTVIFSTGSSLDTGKISGRLIDPDGQPTQPGTAAFAYRIMSDTAFPSPIVSKPLFVTQSGIDGQFSFSGLPFGRYRIFGVSDNNRDLRLSLGKETFFMPLREIVIDGSKPADSTMLLVESFEDTSAVKLVSAKGMSQKAIGIKISRKLPDSSLKLSTFRLVGLRDSAIDTVVSSNVYSFDPVEWIAVFDSLKKGKFRLLWLIDKKLIDTIDLSISPDTSAFRIQIRYAYPADSIMIHWKSIVDTLVVRKGFAVNRLIFKKISDSLVDTVYTPVEGIFYSPTPIRSVFKPAKEFLDGAQYVWSLGDPAPVDSVLRGVFTYRVTTAGTGSISGKVLAPAQNWRVVAINRQGRKRTEVKADNANGKYLLPNLTEGAYRILLYDDSNGNELYDIGSLFPIKYPEQLYVPADSVYVRKRWDVENFDISP
jgi:hypothetical protein